MTLQCEYKLFWMIFMEKFDTRIKQHQSFFILKVEKKKSNKNKN